MIGKKSSRTIWSIGLYHFWKQTLNMLVPFGNTNFKELIVLLLIVAYFVIKFGPKTMITC